jgi:hypothetical protein
MVEYHLKEDLIEDLKFNQFSLPGRRYLNLFSTTSQSLVRSTAQRSKFS